MMSFYGRPGPEIKPVREMKFLRRESKRICGCEKLARRNIIIKGIPKVLCALWNSGNDLPFRFTKTSYREN